MQPFRDLGPRGRIDGSGMADPGVHFVSLWAVCLRQNRQYLENSSLSGVVRLFLVVV
jgi:hypothetical protein